MTAPAADIEVHAEAFLALLRADTELDGTVFEGDVSGNPERYINVFHDTGFFEGHSLNDEPVDVTVTFTANSVGTERWQAVWTAGRVIAAVLGRTPVIPGRRCWRIASAGSQPVHKDTTVEPPVFVAPTRFTIRSTPA